MAYEQVGSGTAGDLKEKLPLLEERLREGDRCELRLTFRSRFLGFNQAAWLVDWSLKQAGSPPGLGRRTWSSWTRSSRPGPSAGLKG